FRPSILEGGAKESHWSSQQVFVIDIDHGITIEKAMEKYLYLNPSLIYTTFNHTNEEHKFRMVFILDEAVHDFNMAKNYQKHLINEIKECDPTCINLNRFYYAGNDIIYKNDVQITVNTSDFNEPVSATYNYNIYNVLKD